MNEQVFAENRTELRERDFNPRSGLFSKKALMISK